LKFIDRPGGEPSSQPEKNEDTFTYVPPHW